MAKKDSTFLNMTLTLLIVTAISAVALGFVYNSTKGPIEDAKAQKLKNAINIVVPGADKGEVEEFKVPSPDGREELTFYKVTHNGELKGYAVNTYSNNGFSGHISVMVGFDENGVIIDNNVLEHAETPGLGDKTSKDVSDWNSQFIGKNPAEFKLNVKKDGGDVDAITAATISSRAYCDALDRAYRGFVAFKESSDSKLVEVSDDNTLIEDNNTEVDSTSNENIGGTK
ncbi:MAG: RnfABCDGE type electron transport complex subunit G [Bacteroidales bacterium]|jgi:electron transport complex protein RnfG|nr:RnfABCDGE type electron transport complex subunit G [Bacteroidales bacterium]